MRAAARLQETSSRGPSVTAARAGGTTGISAVPGTAGSTFWQYIQECVHAHFRRHPRQPQDVEAILATIREDLLRVPDDTVLHDSPRVTAIDLKIVFAQSSSKTEVPV